MGQPDSNVKEDKTLFWSQGFFAKVHILPDFPTSFPFQFEYKLERCYRVK